jgi:predicted methyltransferase
MAQTRHTGPAAGGPRAPGPEALAEVAAAVRLAEGAAGVRDVLRALAGLAPAPTRDVSRATGLPVPLVAAVQNELRERGLLDRGRPSRLTGTGRALADRVAPTVELATACDSCDGTGVRIPERMRPVVDELAALMAAGPAVDATLDQSHCTALTKVRRVLYLLRTGGLPTGSLLLVGDDDLMSIAVGAVGDALGVPLARRVGVLDVDPAVLDYAGADLRRRGIEADLLEHDLREPLPDRWRGGFDVAMTDPPYTPQGARLFLSRAVRGLPDRVGHGVYFSFGPKGPGAAHQVLTAIVELGLTTQAVLRNFNEYLGAGVIGGTSHLYHLVTAVPPVDDPDEAYAGPLYTADLRGAARAYRCVDCAHRVVVGPGTPLPTVADLKAAGCPRCGGTRFRPLQLVPATGAAGPAARHDPERSTKRSD